MFGTSVTFSKLLAKFTDEGDVSDLSFRSTGGSPLVDHNSSLSQSESS